MAGFLTKIKSASSASPSQTSKDAQAKKKESEMVSEVTPLEKMLQNAGPLRQDGSDKFFGFENFGNTCYCNSIVQALFYSDLFRQSVLQYPPHSPSNTPNGTRPKVNVTIRPPMTSTSSEPESNNKNGNTPQALKQKSTNNPGGLNPSGQPLKPEDKPDTPEYKKKQAMLKGPIVELAQENGFAYGMDECTFTGLKDIFLALLESTTRTGVLSPQRFLEIFKRDNEMFRNSMHQDAHEFYGLVLNDVIANVEKNARKFQELEAARGQDGLAQSVADVIGSTALDHAGGYQPPGIGWVHDIFEGVLTSETRCLTCETTSQRDETFLDLSIDLEEHASVTSCLRKFSAEEMLCERNKFHCDLCGGLQEAEKRMKVKRLPKILTLHLKRFKYTEDYSRLQKLFHRVVYPYHLRMFNTTDDAADPDRLYELYAVVVHIGGNAYHGHYVSIIKTKDRGWLLFDDEMVEPVDKHFVRNFFGDRPGMATAYVLFYQETTFENVRRNQEEEGMEEVKLATQAANVAHEDSDKTTDAASLKRQVTQPISMPDHEAFSGLAHAQTAPAIAVPPPASSEVSGTPPSTTPMLAPVQTNSPMTKQDTLSKEDKKREKKEREAAEKAAKQAEKEREKQAKAAAKEAAKEEERRRKQEQLQRIQSQRSEQEELQKAMDASKKSAAEEEDSRRKDNGTAGPMGFLDRSKRGSKTLSRKNFNFFQKDKAGNDSAVVEEGENGDTPEKAPPEKPERTKGRLSIGLGRKKSTNMLS